MELVSLLNYQITGSQLHIQSLKKTSKCFAIYSSKFLPQASATLHFHSSFSWVFSPRRINCKKIPSNKPFIIQKQDVSIQGNSKVEIILRYSKTVQIAHPITISLSKSSRREICPVLSLQSYLFKSQTLIRATVSIQFWFLSILSLGCS